MGHVTYLSMGVHNAAEELPRATAPVHAHHTQYLKEPQAAQRTGGEHLAGCAHTDDHQRCGNRDDICVQQRPR